MNASLLNIRTVKECRRVEPIIASSIFPLGILSTEPQEHLVHKLYFCSNPNSLLFIICLMIHMTHKTLNRVEVILIKGTFTF